MIEKPNISNEKLIFSLNENYSIQATDIEFLPIGNDPSAFAYRVETENQTIFFLKLKKGHSNFAGLSVPHFLKDNGIRQVISPLLTKRQELSVEVDEFTLILYPFIKGSEAMEIGLTNSQWTELGSALKRIHTTHLTNNILQFIRRESFIPKWNESVKVFHQRVNIQEYDDPYQSQLALFWKEKSEIIGTIIERIEEIGTRLQRANLEFFLCHADIHTANILITSNQQMFIIDWDGTMLAPKERDLMFVANLEVDSPFIKGYGDVQINRLALAYYRYEWCVQEFSEYSEIIFSTTEIGESTKKHAIEKFIELFEPSDVVDAALNMLI